jgi:L-fuculose-phosphate aldolase
MTNKQNIVKFVDSAKKLKRNGLVTEGCNKGSISMMLEDGTIVVSPSKIDYDNLSSDNINIMCKDGTYVLKQSQESRDCYFHLAIYNSRPDVKAIIHTHSIYSTALAISNKSIPFITVGMKFHCKGSIDIAPFSFPESPETNELITKHLAQKNAVLVQNHGLICVGETIEDCYETVEFVENLSESYVHALLIGGEIKQI